jgi:heat shock protein HtpX
MIAPYLIGPMYQAREVANQERPDLYQMVEEISRRARMAMPRIMVANIPIPNAFAYGSPIAGTRVAVTTGLLRALEPEEVEAVLGHELGHIRHRDVQIMMFVSVLPALFYYIGFSLSYQVGYRRDRKRASGLAAIGALSMALYFALTMLSLHLSRLREYYADRHSVEVVDDGARKLSEGLAKIVTYSGRMSRMGHAHGVSSFKALFIADPDTAQKDTAQIQSYARTSDEDLVQEILSREPSGFDTFVEVFSTHPNIIKRLRALQKLR